MKRAFLVMVVFAFCLIPAFAQNANLGAFTLQFGDNFQYGDGYSGVIKPKNLMNGYQIKKGESYTLKMKFKVSRDLEKGIVLCFADNTEKAGWWTALTDDITVLETAAKAGQEYSVTVPIVIKTGSTGTSPEANLMEIKTQGEGKKGTAGSGVKKPFEMAISEFILTKN